MFSIAFFQALLGRSVKMHYYSTCPIFLSPLSWDTTMPWCWSMISCLGKVFKVVENSNSVSWKTSLYCSHVWLVWKFAPKSTEMRTFYPRRLMKQVGIWMPKGGVVYYSYSSSDFTNTWIKVSEYFAAIVMLLSKLSSKESWREPIQCSEPVKSWLTSIIICTIFKLPGS